jgi:DNA mismatch endonuclease (patch repair protein)
MRGYRLNVRKLPGVPDLVFGRYRVAVFVDGAFWHGHPDRYQPSRLSAYWNDKIQRTMARDAAANAALAKRGWTVIRLWDFDVLGDAFAATSRIRRALQESDPLLSE